MTTPQVQSFVLISILRGQPKTPPSGDNLGVLDYHLNTYYCLVWMKDESIYPLVAPVKKNKVL